MLWLRFAPKPWEGSQAENPEVMAYVYAPPQHTAQGRAGQGGTGPPHARTHPAEKEKVR